MSQDARALDPATLERVDRAISSLAHAQLVESVDELQAKCANIAATIASFTVDASQVLSLRDDLAGSATTENGNVLHAMKQDIAEATDLSVKVTDRTQELDQVVASVGESTQALISGIATIRKIKLDIFYMALNSNLACTRLGEAGRSVNVASGELRIFADRLEAPAEGIVLQMQEIETARDLLTSGASQSVEGIQAPLESARAAVEKVSAGMDIGLDSLSREGEVVFEAIGKAIQKLDFQSDLGDVLDDCLKIAHPEDAGASAPIPEGIGAIDSLSSKIFKTYTMAQERAIHQRYLPVLTTAISTESATSDEDDLESALF